MSQHDLLKSVGVATTGSVPDIGRELDEALGSFYGHSKLDYLNSHGSWTLGTVSLFDQSPQWYDDTRTNTGNKISARGFKVRINSGSWLVPTSSDPTGCPAVPNGVSIWSVPPNGYTQGEQNAPNLVYYCQVTGALPMVFDWELKRKGSTVWKRIVLGAGGMIDFHTNRTWFGDLKVTIGNEIYGSAKNPISTASMPLTGNQMAVCQIRVYNSYSNHDDYRIDLGRIRCKISNLEVGGGVTYSASMPYVLRILD